jgi:mono/diheme cytochrome c family protein
VKIQSPFVQIYWVLVLVIAITACNTTPYVQGKRLYEAKCQNCHMEDGSGLGTLIPPLDKSTYLGKSALACVLKNGIRDTIFKDSTFLVREMPSFTSLSATEVANIVNFVNHKWAPEFKEITILAISAALDSCITKD